MELVDSLLLYVALILFADRNGVNFYEKCN